MAGEPCHFLWTTVYIEPNGDIYPCCHRQPEAIGNLSRDSISHAFYSASAARIRSAATAGRLPCLSKCTRSPDRPGHHPGGKQSDAAAGPCLEEVHVNLSFRCNIRCIMCRQDHDSRETLDPGRVARAVDWSGSPRVVIQGGEPLILPEAFQLCRYITTHTGSKLTLLTNGTRLTPEWRALLLSGRHEYFVSLNGASAGVHERVNRGSNWDAVMDGLRELAEDRERFSAKTRITLRMTIVPENVSELPAFVGLANREGYVHKIKFGLDKASMPAWAHRNPDEFLEIYTRFLEQAAKSETRCDTRRVDLFAARLNIHSSGLIR